MLHMVSINNIQTLHIMVLVSDTETIQPQQHAMVATINHTNGKYTTVSCSSVVQISANEIIKSY
jgi:hypothetical protein